MVLPAAVLCAFGIACLLAYVLARPGAPLQILDRPNERSLHRVPTPRSGGLAIWAGGLVGLGIALWVFGVRGELGWILGAVTMVGVVSFMDDRLHIPAWMRLGVHFLAGGLLLLGGLGLRYLSLPGLPLALPDASGLVLTLLFIVWMTNLYNFMDGMDGFAGGMAVFGFGTLGLLAYFSGDGYFALLCWVVAASAGGFLVLNFPPARIFMGDTGASALGLLAAAFTLWGDQLSLFPLWVAVLVFSPFIVDATATLLRRVLSRERIWEPHRTHYYQRLVRFGWGHKKTVLAEYALMALCAVSALLCVRLSVFAQWIVIAAWIVVYLCLMLLVDQLDKRMSYERASRRKATQ